MRDQHRWEAYKSIKVSDAVWGWIVELIQQDDWRIIRALTTR